jgi:hypothetical protein
MAGSMEALGRALSPVEQNSLSVGHCLHGLSHHFEFEVGTLDDGFSLGL